MFWYDTYGLRLLSGRTKSPPDYTPVGLGLSSSYCPCLSRAPVVSLTLYLRIPSYYKRILIFFF